MSLYSRLLAAASACLTVSLAMPTSAQAFCGFYVGGAGAKLFNDATMVVLMRQGQQTVLSMRNSYKGPPEAFAMVIPVPVVLQKEDVKTLPRELFDKVDRLAAPRLVEYWERDPCYEPPKADKKSDDKRSGAPASSGVRVEAEFKVGEYDIVILSAEDSTGLDTWLRANKYNIPEGAEPVLRPYVQAGTKFFVAKVDASKVRIVNGRTFLSPLRFHYASKAFNLPIRLGLLNAKGPQDLLVHILAKGQRYEAANYDNVTIPTNLEVTNDVRERFGDFYSALFDQTLARNPGAVVTEYAWSSRKCDPCPGPTLNRRDLQMLGADVLRLQTRDMVLTRLHARYTKETLGEDLVFREAQGIVGGTEARVNGDLPTNARAANYNSFQGRYIIRHRWEGEVSCSDPNYGVWRGRGSRASTSPQTVPANTDKLELASLIAMDVPAIGLSTKVAAPKPREASGCGCEATPGGAAGGFAFIALVMGGVLWRRRRLAP